jgi:hypothetical protein
LRGVLSDLYAPQLGDLSLRWSMITVLLISIGGIWYYLRAASSVVSDLQKS